MANDERQKIINSWDMRADAYGILVSNYRIFMDMAMGLVKFVEKHRATVDKNFRVLDLAAGTGLVSKLLIKRLDIAPSSLYLVEPAENMCIQAQNNIRNAQIYRVTAEDCLSVADLSRNCFDFILCNASMHLMSENDIYPIVSQLLKPKTGYFVYTLWYHAFDETENYVIDHTIDNYVNDALTYFKYPRYFSSINTKNLVKDQSVRSRKYLQETASKNGLTLESCTICVHRTPLCFDLDFMLMSPTWLIEHLRNYEWTQNQDICLMREQIINKVRELIKDKTTEKPVVQVMVSKL